MSIMVKSVNFDDYQKTQTNYKDTNFLQSAEMAGGVFVSLGKHSYCMAPC